MKAKIGHIEIEGGPDEIALLIRSLGNIKILQSVEDSEPELETESTITDDGQFVSTKVAKRALKRRRLSAAQRALLGELRDNFPEWTSALRLQKVTKYNPNQLGGLLGAIGKRVAGTDGYVPGSGFLDWVWDSAENCYLYRLPSSVYEAVAQFEL